MIWSSWIDKSPRASWTISDIPDQICQKVYSKINTEIWREKCLCAFLKQSKKVYYQFVVIGCLTQVGHKGGKGRKEKEMTTP